MRCIKHGRAALCHHLRKYYGGGWYALGRVATGISNVYMGLPRGTTKSA